MIEAHVKRCLGTVVQVRIAEGLGPEAIACPEGGFVVFKQANVHAEVRFVAGGGDHMGRRYPIPRRELFVHHGLRGYAPRKKTQVRESTLPRR